MNFGEVTTILKEHAAPSAIVTAIEISEEEDRRRETSSVAVLFKSTSASKIFHSS
jgi:hypothetical protein